MSKMNVCSSTHHFGFVLDSYYLQILTLPNPLPPKRPVDVQWTFSREIVSMLMAQTTNTPSQAEVNQTR